MSDDPFIDPSVAARIEGELSAIERDHDVTILLAVESGSRAWRFPSRDSDYDVRFIYLGRIETYLTVAARRDVIERPVDAVFDVNGWDLRKALRLLVGSNAVLLEWLTSPRRYRAHGTVPARILELARSHMDLTALAYHYDRQARRMFADMESSGEQVRVKSYLYVVRSILALRWLRERREAPPMDLPSLLAGLPVVISFANRLADLVARKRDMVESDTIARVPEFDAMIGEALAEKIEKTGARDRPHAAARADEMFASVVLEAHGLNQPRPGASTGSFQSEMPNPTLAASPFKKV